MSLCNRRACTSRGLAPELDAIVMCGLSWDREQRYATARDIALELERKLGIATQSEVSDWLQEVAGAALARRASQLRRLQDGARGRLVTQEDAGGPSTRILDPGEVSSSEALPEGSSTPSIETRSRTTLVRLAWPWLVGGVCVMGALVALAVVWLRGDDPAAVTSTSPPPPPAAGATAPAVVHSEELPSGISEVVAGAPAPMRRAQPKRSARAHAKPAREAPDVRPPCSPVIYVDGIRRINPDCPPTVRSKQ